MKALAYALEACLIALLVPVSRALRFCGYSSDGIAIVGWWGSETVGDIAILGQLLIECREVDPDARLTVVSFDTSVTERSLADLGNPDVAIESLGIRSAWTMAMSRCVIVGGGPLMESPSMIAWSWRLRLAYAAGARTLCYANGIGPVRSRRTARAIAALARASTHIVLRDEASRSWLTENVPSVSSTVSFDPAFDYARSRFATISPTRKAQIALALRRPPAAYLDETDTGIATEVFLDTIARSLNVLAESHPIELAGIVMHDGTGDSDDHAIFVALRERLAHPELLVVPAGRHSVDDTIRRIGESRAALTVRFHAMILALATGTPFIAVDYARPQGKVSGAAAMLGREIDVLQWDQVHVDDLAERLRKMIEADPSPVPNLEAARQRRLDLLRQSLN